MADLDPTTFRPETKAPTADPARGQLVGAAG